MGPQTTSQRVVLDTNVLVSTLVLSSQSFDWLREAWQTAVIFPLANEETARELMEVLGYSRFGLTLIEQAGLMAEYLAWCEIVTDAVPPSVPYCRDPDDLPFLQLALAGAADFLVTGDRDLLALAPECPVPIVTPAAFRQIMHP